MKRGPEADIVCFAPRLECADRICEYVGGDEVRFRASSLIQDVVVHNLQTLAGLSQRLTDAIKASERDVCSMFLMLTPVTLFSSEPRELKILQSQIFTRSKVASSGRELKAI